MRTNIFGFLKSFLIYVKDEVKWRIKPKGLYIGFVGVDGSGKSTIIDGLVTKVLSIVRENRIVIYHLFPGSLRKDGFSVDPHSRPEYSLIIGFIKETYLLFKYWSNYFKLKDTLSRTKLVIMDRLNYDIIVDPRRFRLKKLFLKQFFKKLIFTPDIIFYCRANPLSIYNRKKELSVDEIERQQSILDKLLIDNKNWVEINTNNLNPLNAIEQVVNEVVFFLKEREN